MKCVYLFFWVFVSDIHIRYGEGGFSVQNVPFSSAFLCDGVNVVIPKGGTSDSLVSVIV